MQTVFLVRHASPDWSRTDLIYYQTPGPPLTSHGIEEAHALSDFLVTVNVQVVYSSPLDRCLSTARVISQRIGQPVNILESLQESQPGEPVDQVKTRMCSAFQLATSVISAGNTAVLVSHGGPIGALLLALGMDAKRLNSHRTYDHRNPVPTAGVWRVSRPSDDQPWLLQLVYTPQSEPHPSR